MKKIILIVITCFIIQVDYIYSQTNYVSFQDSCIWSVNTHKYMTYSDTIINGKNYLKVYYHSENVPFEFDMEKASYFCAIRNDTTNKKVYGVYYKPTYVIYEGDFYSGSYKEYLSADTTEFLLYDFSLQISDTVTIASFEHDIDKIILLIAQRDTSMYIWYYDDNVYIDKHIVLMFSTFTDHTAEKSKRGWNILL